MSRTELSNSEKICKKCKILNLSRDQTKVSLKLKNPGRALTLHSQLNPESKFFIFRSKALALRFFSDVEPVIRSELNKLNFENVQPDFSQVEEFYEEPFTQLKNCVLKILFDQLVDSDQLQALTPLEKDVLILFCKKKRLANSENATPTSDFFEAVWKSPTRKSKEESLKFVFKKSYKILKSIFLRAQKPEHLTYLKKPYQQLEPASQNEYLFTAFYFQRQAVRLNTPLEFFFQPSTQRNFEILNPIHALKSLNKKFLERIKREKVFVGHLVFLVSKHLAPICRKEILKKADELIFRWEEMYIDRGTRFLKKEVAKQLKQHSKTKLPWTLHEVKSAIQQVISLVRD